MPYKNPEDRRACNARYYSRNAEAIKIRKKQDPRRKSLGSYNKTLRDRNAEFVQKYKSTRSCVDCDRTYHYSVMDFDHVRGTKVGSVSTLANYGYSIESIQKEIDKCDLVCANCHRYRTWERGRYANGEQADSKSATT